MKSSSGEHYLALDHVRALAALMVFVWHFSHGLHGRPVPFEYAPALPPLTLLEEGHTGVALFMTLSGYLFAKLLDGKRIDYRCFVWNRALRLLPLLLLVMLLAGLIGTLGAADPQAHLRAYLRELALGVLYPTWPNGGWSITVELHFYLLLPLLLWLFARSRWWPLALLALALLARCWLWAERGSAQPLAYWTLVGRIDQFVLGMLLFQLRHRVAGRHVLALLTGAAFMAFYHGFNLAGGWMRLPAYPSPSALWIVMPTLEGLAYAVLIAWYDNSFRPSDRGVSRFVASLGAYSYSIYLLHLFFVDALVRAIGRFADLSNFYVACAFALLCFVLMWPIGHISFRFVEAPFLRLRKPYVRA